MAAPDEWARTDVGPAPTVAIKYMGCGDDGNLGIRTTSLPLRTRHDDVLADGQRSYFIRYLPLSRGALERVGAGRLGRAVAARVGALARHDA